MTQSEASPVPCLKERFHHITGFAFEDYVFEIGGKVLERMGF